MMKKLYLIIGLLVLIAGCTGGTTTSGGSCPSGGATGNLIFDVSIEDNVINPGDTTVIDLSIQNLFSQDLQNVIVSLAPIHSGIDYTIDGPDTVLTNDTEDWTIIVNTSPGMQARETPYELYPVICFDYTQEQIAFFRVAPGTPTSSCVDYSLSDSGPLDINFQGIRAASINQDDKLDVSVSFSFGNGISGGSHTYYDGNSPDIDQVSILEGEFVLSSVNELLTLYAPTESGINKDANNYCPIQTGGSNAGSAVCYFTQDAEVNGGDIFNFDFKFADSFPSEVETSFKTSITYTYCFKSTSTVTNLILEEDN